MVDLNVNDVITLKKKHACGEDAFVIARIGMDVKLQCKKCGRYINLTRDEFRKSVRMAEDKEWRLV